MSERPPSYERLGHRHHPYVAACLRCEIEREWEALEARLVANDLKIKSNDSLISQQREMIAAYERVAEAARKMDQSSPTLNSPAYRAARREFRAALSALQASEDRTIGDTDSTTSPYLDTEGKL